MSDQQDGAPPAIALESIQAGYGNLTVLRDVSLHVQEGEFITLIGNNGAGKTTLLLVISGIIRPSRGTVRLKGRPIEEFQPHELVRHGVAHVPQGRQLFPEMTVLENLQLGGMTIPGDEEIQERLEAIYQYFPKLGKRPNQPAGTLSGGEQQMLAIARALMSSPDVLLLDEPSAGLAPVILDGLAEVIGQLHSEGMTVLLVEQDAMLALELAERAYVLEAGEIVESGSTSELRGSERVRRAYLGI